MPGCWRRRTRRSRRSAHSWERHVPKRPHPTAGSAGGSPLSTAGRGAVERPAAAGSRGAAGLSRRAQNKQANREAILAAAQRVFLERGFEAVTIRDVVRETPLASGTFYNYFRT